MKEQPWHAHFLESLGEASDVDLRRRAWIDQSGPHFPDPVELVCQIFDDSGIDDLTAKGVVFSEVTDAMLKRLSGLSQELDLDADPEVLLSSEAWIEFRRHAARVLALVRDDLAEDNPDPG